jgi:hypothetical protein
MKSNKKTSQTDPTPEDMANMLDNYAWNDNTIKVFDNSTLSQSMQSFSQEEIKKIALEVSDILSVASNKDIIAHYVDLKIKYDDLEERFKKIEKSASEYMKENQYLRDKFEKILLL